MQNYEFQDIKSGYGPREKLIERGPDVLTESELLAIIFVTGTRSENVLELSNRILKEYGSRSISNIRDVGHAIDVLNIGRSKACQLVSMFEIGRRFYKEQTGRMPKIKDPEDVYQLLKNMGNLKKEELRALYLNSRQNLVREELVSLGNENMNIVTPKEIIQPAVEILARGVIIVHNHPSGEPNPSDQDIKFTRRIQEACEIMGIEFLDHIIIGDERFTSLKIEGII